MTPQEIKIKVAEQALAKANEAIAANASEEARVDRAANPPKSGDFGNYARLSTVPKSGYAGGWEEGAIVIYLPHLPESLDLGRENTYETTNNLAMPDGLWIYQHTSPLELPLAFSLHAFDDLCPEGGKTLLSIAAKLSSLELPAKNDTIYMESKKVPKEKPANKRESLEKDRANAKKKLEAVTKQAPDNYPNFPPACSLRLIKAGASGLGIDCVGFIKSVKVSLHAPFLQTEDPDAFNIPSAATYSFTFVHNPSYTNNLGSGAQVHAFAPDVLKYFYNTKHLASMTGNTYSDIEELDPTRTANRY